MLMLFEMLIQIMMIVVLYEQLLMNANNHQLNHHNHLIQYRQVHDDQLLKQILKNYV